MDDANKCVQANRDLLAAKIVHDQVRFNQFLRDLSTKYDAFKTDDKIWDLDADKVEEAEKLIIQIEKKITQKCPLNVNVKKQIQSSDGAFQGTNNM